MLLIPYVSLNYNRIKDNYAYTSVCVKGQNLLQNLTSSPVSFLTR